MCGTCGLEGIYGFFLYIFLLLRATGALQKS